MLTIGVVEGVKGVKFNYPSMTGAGSNPGSPNIAPISEAWTPKSYFMPPINVYCISVQKNMENPDLKNTLESNHNPWSEKKYLIKLCNDVKLF